MDSSSMLDVGAIPCWPSLPTAFNMARLLVLILLAIPSPAQSEYCEIFQLPGFNGESVRIPDSHQVPNVTRLTHSWTNSSRPLYSIRIQEQVPCEALICTQEHFGGNCTTLAVSRKRIRVSRLLSFACKCRAREGDSTTEKDPSSGEKCLHEDSDGQFGGKNFVKYGKKIIGVGRNYVWNKTELSKVLEVPETPIIFLKPTTSYLEEGHSIMLPDLGTIYYEIELGVVIGKPGINIEEKNALDHVAGYVLALDLTAKDFLKKSISKGLPWEIGKGFDTACPVGAFLPKSCIADPHNLTLSLWVNRELRQRESTGGMLFRIPQLISYISKYFTLESNDVILTGTPDGIGPIRSGDLIEGALGDIAKIKFNVY